MSLQRTGLAIKRLQMQHHRAMNAALVELGITIVQWDALRHLSENPGASLHDLAVLTFQTDQAFGTLAQRLEERGLVASRTESPQEGRMGRPRKYYSVRREGARALQDSYSTIQSMAGGLLTKLSELAEG